MGRYTLTMETYDNQTIHFIFSEKGRKTSKVSLKTIDDFTTKTSGPEELMKKLNESGKLEKDMLKGIKITYLINKKVKTTPIAYQDKHDLTKLTMEQNSKINQNNSVFLSNIYKFLATLENKDFYVFTMHSSLLSMKQKEYIERRIENGDYGKFCEDKIKQYSGDYRQFRNILFLMEAFHKLNKVVELPSYTKEEDDYDPDKEGFLSEEEKQKYNDYMESLPSDVPDYMYKYEEDEKVKSII